MYATEQEKNWLAAAIDGEGSITFTFERIKRKTKEGSQTYFVFLPIIIVTNKNKDFCEKVKEIMQKMTGTGYCYKYGPHNVYTTRNTSSRSVHLILKEIKDLLIVKKPHAELLLKVLESRIQRYYSEREVRQRSFTQQEKKWLVELRRLQEKPKSFEHKTRDIDSWLEAGSELNKGGRQEV